MMIKKEKFSTETCLKFLNWKLNNIQNYSKIPNINSDIKIISTTSSNRIVSGYEDNVYNNKIQKPIILKDIPISVQLFYTDKEKEEYKVEKVNLNCTINYLPQSEPTNLKTCGVVINYEGQDNFLFERDKKSNNKYPYFESSLINNLFCFDGVRKAIKEKLAIQLTILNKNNKFKAQPNILRQKLIISGEEPFTTAREFSKSLDIKDLCLKINEILYSNSIIKEDLDKLNSKHGPNLEDCVQYKAVVEAKVVKYIKKIKNKKRKQTNAGNTKKDVTQDSSQNPQTGKGDGNKRKRRQVNINNDEFLEQEEEKIVASNKNKDELLSSDLTMEKPVEDTDKVITLTDILVGTTSNNRNCIQVKLIEDGFDEYSSCKELIERIEEKDGECLPNLLMFPTENLENIIYVNVHHPTYILIKDFAQQHNSNLDLTIVLAKCKQIITEIVVECIFDIYSIKQIKYCTHNNKSNAQQLSDEIQSIYKKIGFNYWPALDLCLKLSNFEVAYKQLK